jgi:hypothetical protein
MGVRVPSLFRYNCLFGTAVLRTHESLLNFREKLGLMQKKVGKVEIFGNRF